MTDTYALIKLMSWLSPVFPTGGFAYSAGLEQAVKDNLIIDINGLQEWLTENLCVGALWNDAVVFNATHRGEDVTDLCLALCNAAERRNEMLNQGAAFYDAAQPWFENGQLGSHQTPIPILVARAACLENIDAEQAIAAYLHTYVSNQLQCAIRLSVIGQTGATQILAHLENVIEQTAHKASKSTLDNLGTSTFMADIAAMNHQTLQPRLFLS